MNQIDTLFRRLCNSSGKIEQTFLRKVYTSMLDRYADYAVVDGGAHKGVHTRRFANLTGCRAVLAVEADPHTFGVLEQFMADFPEERRDKVRLIQMALQDRSDRTSVSWMSCESHPGRSGISSIWQKDPDVTFRPEATVAATTIDRLRAGAGFPVKFLKLDLEGGEFTALQGASETLARDRPIVVFENSRRATQIYGYTIEDVLAFFERHGYAVVTSFSQMATPKTFFRFHEVWAAPQDTAEVLVRHLRKARRAIVDEAASA